MVLSHILTERKISSWPSWHLVYEWEDVLKEQLGVKYVFTNKLLDAKLFKWLPLPFLGKMAIWGKSCLRFEMYSKLRNGIWNNGNIMPWIIDFYIGESELHKFEAAYRGNKLVLVSSREVYEWLKAHGAKLKVIHLALSISDKYRITPTTRFEKQYDLVLMGRQNPVLEGYLKRYLEQHPDLYVVYRTKADGQFIYKTSKGEELGDISSREAYMELMRKARIGFYSTPGTDNKSGSTKGFSQVTPRLLELMSAGCHIIGRYVKNADTDYYELERICDSVDSYEQFEHEINEKLKAEVNMGMYSEYLSKHYTSVRAKQLQDILKNIQ